MSGGTRSRAEEGRRRATIAEVAASAGVSAPTVSRVLTGSANVTPDTRARVEEAIERLHYRPNAFARALSSGRIAAVGAVVPFVTHPSAVQRVRGLIDGLREAAIPLMLYDVEQPHDCGRHLEALTSTHAPAGAIVVSITPSDTELEAFRQAALPGVFIDVAVPGFPSVTVDHREAGRIAAEHLIELGHRRIGFVGDYEANPYGFTSSEHHRRGVRDALIDEGIEIDPVLEAMGGHGRDEARSLTHRLLSLEQPPTAVVAASDTQAAGAIEAAGERDVRVPEDLSIVGFDDIETSRHLGLTTVRQPLESSGRMAAEMLIAAMDDPDRPPIHEQLPVELIVRATTDTREEDTPRKET